MNPDPQSEIRAAFRERRLRLGLTQSAMAAHLGINRMAYIRAEQSARISPELRVRIHGILLRLEAELKEQIKQWGTHQA